MNYLRTYIKDRLPDNLVFGQLVLRRASSWQQAGLIFVHVPKNGGTSINSMLYGKFMGHYRVRDIERIRPDLLGRLPSLALTRNPWARAYSAWSFARQGATMSDGPIIRYPERFQDSQFETFERFVLEWLPNRNIDQEDYVFRTQSHFLVNSQNKVGIQHLGRIEKKESYLPFLEEALGRKLKVEHLNRTSSKYQYREYYNSEMRDTVARCYACDLEKFDYEF